MEPHTVGVTIVETLRLSDEAIFSEGGNSPHPQIVRCGPDSPLFYRLRADFVSKFVSLNIMPVRSRSKPIDDHRSLFLRVHKIRAEFDNKRCA